jgi:hypothetical protein
MRALLLILGGALLGAAIATTYCHFKDAAEASRADRGGLLGGLESASAKVEVGDLSGGPVPNAQRTESSESTTDPSTPGEKAGDAPSAPPVLNDLLELLEARDARGLAAQLELLLASGPGGYPLLEEFLSSALGPPDFSLLADAKLALAFQGLALKRPAEFADLSRQLLFGPAASTSGPLKAHLLKFLPAFLALHGDRFPELQGEVALTFQRNLESFDPRLNLAQILAGLRDLGVEPSLDSLESVLGDPERRHQQGLVLRELGRRGDRASLQAIVRSIEAAVGSETYRFEQAFGAIAEMDLPEAKAALESYLSSPVDEHRSPAVISYFSRPRDSSAFSLAVEFLRSDATIGWKNLLLERLEEKSPEILGAIRALGPEMGVPLDPGAPRVLVAEPAAAE